MKENAWYPVEQPNREAAEPNRLPEDMESFIYMVAHEMKTPLREIELLAEFIYEDNRKGLLPQSVEDLQSIQRTCKESVSLMYKMMEYSKVDFKVMENRKIDMLLLVRQCFEEIAKTVSDRRITLELSDIPALFGDMFLIKLLVTNILSNSIKFTRETVNAAIRVFATRHDEENTVTYHFRDNGIGFDMTYVSNLFDIFERLHSDGRYDGNGIGLATVKKIAERFNGRVEIEGKLYHGCEVRVILPARLLADGNAALPAAPFKNDTIRIGVIGDFSGEGALYEVSKHAAYKLAAREINDRGGIAGRMVELIFKDGQSDVAVTRERAIELITRDRVDVIMGATYALTRECIRAVADRYRTLFIENQQTEGGVVNHYTFCISACPEQQFYHMMKYLLRQYGHKCYIVSSDYHFSILSAEWVKHIVHSFGGEILGVEYLDDTTLTDYTATIQNIKNLKPNIVVPLLIFSKSTEFFRQWHACEMNYIPLASSVTVVENGIHHRLDAPILENTYAMASFLEELDSEPARDFVKRFRDRFDRSKVPYMNMETESAYTGLYLYKAAVEMAGTTETEAVIRAFETGEVFFDGPGGRVTIKGEDHQTIRDVSLFRVDKQHRIEVVSRFEEVQSDYVEQMIERTLAVKGGMKSLGLNSPNVQYNLLLNKP